MTSEPETSYGPSETVLQRRARERRRLAVQRRRIGAAIVAFALFVGLIAGIGSLLSGGSSGRAKASGLGGLATPLAGGASRERSPKVQANENLAVDRVLAYTPFVSRGGTRKREVALTFDDGPGPYTHRLIGVLRKLRVPATFFQVGVMIPVFRGPGSEVRRYFPVGDHTVSHPLLARLPRAQQQEQIAGDVGRLRLEQAPTPRLFRPPYASFNADTLAVIKPLRMLMVLWSVDSRDYTRPGVQRIVYNVLSAVKPGAIVLMHDAGGDRSQTIAALPTIIRKLRKRHFRLVTVPQMLHDAPPPRNQKLPPLGGESTAVAPAPAAAKPPHR